MTTGIPDLDDSVSANAVYRVDAGAVELPGSLVAIAADLPQTSVSLTPSVWAAPRPYPQQANHRDFTLAHKALQSDRPVPERVHSPTREAPGDLQQTVENPSIPGSSRC